MSWQKPLEGENKQPTDSEGYKRNLSCFRVKRLVLPARWIRSIKGDEWEWFPKPWEISCAPQWSHIWWLWDISCTRWHLSLSLPRVPVACSHYLTVKASLPSWEPWWGHALCPRQLPNKGKKRREDWNAPGRESWKDKYFWPLPHSVPPLSCFGHQSDSSKKPTGTICIRQESLVGRFPLPRHFIMKSFKSIAKWKEFYPPLDSTTSILFFLALSRFYCSAHFSFFLIHFRVSCTHQHTLVGNF